MPINRSKSPTQAKFTVGLNIVLTGSKNMTDEEQDRLMTVEKVRVLIIDAADETNILLDEFAKARLFSTGSVGFGLNIRNAVFGRTT